MLTFAFWGMIFLIVYCYFGYPVLVAVLAKFFSRPVRKAAMEPTVSIVLSACNEEDVIAAKIQNLLSLDYPSDKLELIIGSDGSTDRTDEIVRNFTDARLHFFSYKERRGKTATLNDLISRARHEVVVFTDARQLFAPQAVHALVRNFTDPGVGCVSGELIFRREEGEGGTAKGINLYWEYEKFIRRHESRLHSMLGATGAIYAIRRELYTPVPATVVLDDMFIPLKIIQKGYRAVFEESAEAFDRAADNPKEEYRRKTRTLYGNYQIFGIFPALFIPFSSPVALQLFSHKLLRVLAPFFMLGVFVLNFFLLERDVYTVMFVLQNIFYGLALTGALSRNRNYGILAPVSKITFVPYVFCLLNFSALIGFIRFIGTRQPVTWEKAREG